MAHTSLYRRFRPASWAAVIGQDHIVTTLINQIKSDTVSHAYLFTGSRGTGKTSCAKIFARAVNCLQPDNGSPCGVCSHCIALGDPSNLDVIEMDAASNNGVEEIRELKENVQYPPTSVRYKVYIIDEVHMLTGSAFNALLKTLEEPPSHAIFVLATTEVHKLPPTILSRCLRFDFRLVTQDKLAALLAKIFGEISYDYQPEALDLLAIHGEGSVRDTLSIADMCMSYSPDRLTSDAVLEVLGASDFDTLFAITEGVLTGQTGKVLDATHKTYLRGKGISTLNRELSALLRDLIAVKNVPLYRSAYNDTQYAMLKALADSCDNYRLGRAMDILASVENLARYSTQPQIVLDASLIKAAELQTEPNIDALISRIRALETKLKEIEQSGIRPLPSTPAADTQTATPAVSVAAVLREVATVTQDAPVFSDETDDAPQEPDGIAQSIMSGLLTAVREQKYNLLYRALLQQEVYTLQDTTLTVTVSDAASWSLLSANDNPLLLQRLIAEAFNNEYSIQFNRTSNKEEIRSGSLNTLVSLFGDKLQDKNKQ